MSTDRENLALGEQLGAFRIALKSKDLRTVAPFFADRADFGSVRGIMRGWDEIAATSGELLSLRESADVVSSKWLSKEIALVDGVFDTGEGRGWFTEIWHKSDGKNYLISLSRSRVGSPSASFDAFSRLSPHTIPNDDLGSIQQEEEEELRKQFKAFRTAINNGDSKGVAALFTPDCDAIVAFSFLQGRAQILNGRTAVGDKADRMNPGALVSNPATLESQGANFVGGEPKVIRFLSPTVAVVDGTAEIAGIPRAHGFSPKEMTGVYTDVWHKSDGQWLIAGSRPWF
jgi:ketosteroid isomerase-like protein